MFRRQHVGGTLVGLRAEHADGALDGLGGHALAGADDRDELVEQPLGERDLGGLAAQRDLVAADVDVGVEGLLDQCRRCSSPGPRRATMLMLFGTTMVWAGVSGRSCGPVSGTVMGGARPTSGL